VAGDPNRDDIERALAKVLDWPEIARSPQLARFIDYIVRRKLDGDEQSIKAYSIAVDVLGRPPDFDPQSDPIVRVQARRLRALLEQYYRTDGAGDVVHIHLPVGRYIPDFLAAGAASKAEIEQDMAPPQPPPPAVSVAPPRRKRGEITVPWFVLVVGIFAILALAYSLLTLGPRQPVQASPAGLLSRPIASVVEFQSLTGDPADTRLAAGLAVELVTDLDQFETITTLYGGSMGGSAAGNGVDYILSGIVRREGQMLQYSAILTEVVTSSVVWSKVVSLTPEEAARPDVLDYVSGLLGRVLGSPRGPVHAKARALLLNGSLSAADENLYLCRMLFDLYRERENAAMAERASNCFQTLPERDRRSGQALAGLASLLVETTGADSGGRSRMEVVDLAQVMLNEAIEASPTSGFVWEQRARLFEAMGRHGEAEAAYGSALQLNSANTDTIAARARHLAFTGRLEAAEALAWGAINTAPDAPAWYLCVPLLVALKDGEFAAAMELAERYAETDRELGPILTIMAAQGLGDGEMVNRYLPRVLDVQAFRRAGVLTQLRRRITDDDLLARVRQSLVAAGLSPAALVGPF